MYLKRVTLQQTNLNCNGDTAITARLGYILTSTYLYFDVRNYSTSVKDDVGLAKDAKFTKFTNFLLGAEYYF